LPGVLRELENAPPVLSDTEIPSEPVEEIYEISGILLEFERAELLLDSSGLVVH
jgi:hypothetical protein